ncbi:PP2C family protein-serine/threonine phosphatase [Streptomyces sp. NPDC021224]|uniref:PP2C family protein-serine/threonine phosphatase n=1 Tax=unclassified Streptomyces TaxID=2593676 RepID=UPI0037B4C8E2
MAGRKDSAFAEAMRGLLAQAHTCDPGRLPDLVSRAAAAMGAVSAGVYLADLQQRDLVPLPGSRGVGGEPAGPVAIEGSLAGRAYRTMTVQTSDEGGPGLWLPILNGSARVGVLRVGLRTAEAEAIEDCRALASVTGLLVGSQAAFSDELARVTRSKPMQVAAEMVWAFLPPTTIGNDLVTSTALLEPAYQLAGDAFDHTLTEDRLRVTVVDAMGHDLASGLSSAVALAGGRASRRAGGALADLVTGIDEELNRWAPGRMLTGVFADLDLSDGTLQWVNCGHLPPLLIREGSAVDGALEREPVLPLGLGARFPRERPVHRASLQPGDRVVFYTDGITEARSTDGEMFGEERLIDFVVKATAAGEPSPEATRRLLHAILEHHDNQLGDDAVVMVVEWHPGS